jgi:hypothetical protein
MAGEPAGLPDALAAALAGVVSFLEGHVRTVAQGMVRDELAAREPAAPAVPAGPPAAEVPSLARELYQQWRAGQRETVPWGSLEPREQGRWWRVASRALDLAAPGRPWHCRVLACLDGGPAGVASSRDKALEAVSPWDLGGPASWSPPWRRPLMHPLLVLPACPARQAGSHPASKIASQVAS